MSDKGEPTKKKKKKELWQHVVTYKREAQADRENEEVKDVFENDGNKYPKVTRFTLSFKKPHNWTAHAWIDGKDMILTGEEGNEHHSRESAVIKLKEDLEKYAAGTYDNDE